MVVKVQENAAARVAPDWPVAAVLMVTVYGVEYASGEEGVNVAVLPLTATVPETVGEMLIAPAIDVATIGSENVALIAVPGAALLFPRPGQSNVPTPHLYFPGGAPVKGLTVSLRFAAADAARDDHPQEKGETPSLTESFPKGAPSGVKANPLRDR